ncbi:MAG: hypothetical protein SFV81_21950 [Pirellulaceae bacterium]|nr:hypothetical protein [Pirellulaceae bacterium]
MVGWSMNAFEANSIKKSHGNSLGNFLGHCLRNAGLLLGLFAVGCSEDMAIRQYTVDKSEANRASSGPTPALTEQQMLAAIVPNRQSTWFIKLTGTPADVAATEAQFREIVNSIKFAESGDPSWKLANGWTEQRVGGMTFAKLKDEQRGLSATVTQLASPQEADGTAWQDWVKVNVNRWRGQLALAEQEWDAMKAELEELPPLNQGEARAYYVSLVGKGSGKMGGPFSGGPMSGGPFSGSTNAPAMPPTATGNQAPELTYAVPPGWEQAPASGMRLATFKVSGDGLQAEVTVISAGGDDRSNVARWQRQLTPDASEEAIDALMKEAERVEVNGLPVDLYSIKGKEGPEQGAFLAAIVPWQPSSKLFVKFTGPAKLADQQRESFTMFVKSLKW